MGASILHVLKSDVINYMLINTLYTIPSYGI